MTTKVIDGKKVVIKSNPTKIPPTSIIKKVYAKIPDDKKIPIVFETKTQYLNEYIKNQEKARGKPFPKREVTKYKNTELERMSNIVSRYTTKHNPYIDVRTVFFTDNKITPTQFAKSAYHEYGHEAWENNPKLKKDWRSVSKTSAPTPYGKTARQEDFAESYMLYKTGELGDTNRAAIISDAISPSRKTASIRQMIPSTRIDLAEFDMNHDGQVNDLDIEIMRKKGLLKGLVKDPGKNRVGHVEPQAIKHIPIPDKKGWHGDIEKETIQNPNFRKVVFTGRNAQLVFMSLKPKEEIGNEVHPVVDQFFRMEQGKALFSLGNGKVKYTAGKTGSVLVPAGTWHNVTNIGKKPAKLYTIYSPPQHPVDKIQRDKPSQDMINLKNPLKARFGTVRWQNIMEHNINEKMAHNEELGPMEKSYIETQGEIHPPEDIEITFRPVRDKPGKDRYSMDSVADALGWAVPENVLAGASWKLYGAPKKYDPRYQERANLKGNIFRLTREHYTTIGKNPFLSTDITSQDLNLLDIAGGIGKGAALAKQRLSKENIARTYAGEDRPNIGMPTRQKIKILPAAGKGLKWVAGKAVLAGQAMAKAGMPPEYYAQLAKGGVIGEKQEAIGKALSEGYTTGKQALEEQYYAAGARRDIAGGTKPATQPVLFGTMREPKWLSSVTRPLTMASRQVQTSATVPTPITDREEIPYIIPEQPLIRLSGEQFRPVERLGWEGVHETKPWAL